MDNISKKTLIDFFEEKISITWGNLLEDKFLAPAMQRFLADMGWSWEYFARIVGLDKTEIMRFATNKHSYEEKIIQALETRKANINDERKSAQIDKFVSELPSLTYRYAEYEFTVAKG